MALSQNFGKEQRWMINLLLGILMGFDNLPLIPSVQEGPGDQDSRDHPKEREITGGVIIPANRPRVRNPVEDIPQAGACMS